MKTNETQSFLVSVTYLKSCTYSLNVNFLAFAKNNANLTSVITT